MHNNKKNSKLNLNKTRFIPNAPIWSSTVYLIQIWLIIILYFILKWFKK